MANDKVGIEVAIRELAEGMLLLQAQVTALRVLLTQAGVQIDEAKFTAAVAEIEAGLTAEMDAKLPAIDLSAIRRH